MSTDLFIDSSGYFALLNHRDDRHAEATDIMRRLAAGGRMAVTTDYILDETATLLRARGHYPYAVILLETLRRAKACEVVSVTPPLFDEAAHLFIRHKDSEFSFTDCTNFAIMRKLGLRDALSKDRDFRAAGFNQLLM
jgi:predicted nucleic acid-binding protein